MSKQNKFWVLQLSTKHKGRNFTYSSPFHAATWSQVPVVETTATFFNHPNSLDIVFVVFFVEIDTPAGNASWTTQKLKALSINYVPVYTRRPLERLFTTLRITTEFLANNIVSLHYFRWSCTTPSSRIWNLACEVNFAFLSLFQIHVKHIQLVLRLQFVLCSVSVAVEQAERKNPLVYTFVLNSPK